MREAPPDPFVVVGFDSLAGVSPSSASRVRAFYKNRSPLESAEMQALSAVGMDLLQDRGRGLAWSWEESYESLTVRPRLIGPSALWNEAVAEAQESLARLATTGHEDHRRRLVEEQAARDDYLAAERNAQATGRLWGRFTSGHKEARGQAARLKAIHAGTRDPAARAARVGGAATWLSDHLVEGAQIAANVMSQRWTGWSCIGRWEEEIEYSDVQKIAAARVIGQATIGLMLSDLISDDVYGRLLEPWHASMSRVPWQLEDLPKMGDIDGQVPAEPSGKSQTMETSTVGPDPESEPDHHLTALLELAHQADGSERISYRDQVAAFGRAAIRPMAGWLTDPKLGAFAARVLERIAVGTDAELVHNVLGKALSDVSIPSVRDDIQGILRKLEPIIRLTQTHEWMAAQGSRGHRSQWTIDEAERLVKKIERLDARRRAAGRPSLSASNWEEAVALQFRGFGSRPYTNHCWTPSCGGSIDSEINARCDACNMFFCDSCGACMCERG